MVYYFTPEGFKKIKKKLRELKEKFTKTPLKEEKIVLKDSILEAEQKIKEGKVVIKKQTDKVQIGSTVLVKINDKEVKFNIVGKGLIDPSKGNISYESPLGAALTGKSVGDSVEVEINGEKISCVIIEIK